MERQFFVFRGVDHGGGGATRAGLLDAHRAYVRAGAAVAMRHGGPLVDAQGETIGSCLILEADSRADVEAWLAAEPFNRAGLFASSTIERWGWTYGR